jgi:hypothetical protein
VSPFSKPTVHRQVGEKHNQAGKEGQVMGRAELGCLLSASWLQRSTGSKWIPDPGRLPQQLRVPCTALHAAVSRPCRCLHSEMTETSTAHKPAAAQYNLHPPATEHVWYAASCHTCRHLTSQLTYVCTQQQRTLR